MAGSPEPLVAAYRETGSTISLGQAPGWRVSAWNTASPRWGEPGGSAGRSMWSPQWDALQEFRLRLVW